MTLSEKIKALHSLVGEGGLNTWSDKFIVEVLWRTGNGTDTAFLNVEQIAEINWLYLKFIGDKK